MCVHTCGCERRMTLDFLLHHSPPPRGPYSYDTRSPRESGVRLVSNKLQKFFHFFSTLIDACAMLDYALVPSWFLVVLIHNLGVQQVLLSADPFYQPKDAYSST